MLLMNNELVKLSNDIKVITAEINAYQRVAGEAIFEIGRRLQNVRNDPEKYGFSGYRDWERWCEDELDMKRSHANRYIRVYERFGMESPGIPIQQSITILYILASYSDEELEKPREMPDGSTKKLTEMSRREIEEFKRRERRIIEEREAAIRVAEEAERRAEQAEEDKRKLGQLLTEERNKQPEVEYIIDPDTETKLERYEELFGDQSIYDGDITRVTDGDAITYAVFEFSEDMRKLIEKYSYLTHYANEFNQMIDEGKEKYTQSIHAMFSFLNSIERNINSQDAVIINE